MITFIIGQIKSQLWKITWVEFEIKNNTCLSGRSGENPLYMNDSVLITVISQIFRICSPLKFAGGDCWPRGPTMVAGSSGEQPMDVSTVEQMDTSSSNTTEASAPLPIRHPSGINAGPYKKQAYPMNSKRPEHLRMNLWRLACLRTLGLFQFCLFLSFYDILFYFNFGKLTPSAPITSSSNHTFSSLESKVLLTPDAWPPQSTAVDVHSVRGRCERSAYRWNLICSLAA